MTELDLHISDFATSENGVAELQPDRVQRRIESLPTLDMPMRINGLLELLTDIHRTELPAERLIKLLNIVDRELEPLLSGYKNEIRHCHFPFPEHRFSLYLELQELLSTGASCYKKLIQQLLDTPDAGSNQTHLRDAILRCIGYLSQQALQAYAVYEEPASSLWKDLHQLYAYSEKQQLESEVVEHLSDLSISGAYSRVLLLALSNPYHLMQGEVHHAYEYLGKWAIAVRLEHPDELSPLPTHELINARFYCDLAGESPPDYGTEGITATPKAPRLLDLKEVLRIIEGRMKVLALNSRQSLQLRTEWDLLHRLRKSWEKRLVRNGSRQIERGTTVKAVTGLSSCHCFFTGYAPFEPEQAEITMHGDNFKNTSTLSLVSTEETPWLDTDACTKLEAGIIKPRAYRFDMEDQENDIWKKANSSGHRQTTDLEKKIEERALGSVYEFTLVNSSIGGECLGTKPGSAVQLRVGELIAAFPHGEPDSSDPELNVVCWIHSGLDRKLSIGLQHIPGETNPIAVRALDKQARYGDYSRAFLVQDEPGNASLIIPAGLFECGSTILCQDEQRLEAIQLKSLVRNTRAFSQYTFKRIDIDHEMSAEITGSLKQLLYRGID